VDRHLDVVRVGDAQARVDRRGGRSPVLVELKPAGARGELLDQRGFARGVALAE
jgi:hypothetical protein